MFRGLITTIRTLSIIPVPGRDAEQLSSSLPWFPLVGFMLGGILYTVVILMDLILKNIWPEGVAIIILGCGILLTRGIHMDGLADWADGFGGGHDKQKTLYIMKDPHIGVFGVISVVAVVLAKWISLTRIIVSESTIWIIAAYIVSRTMQVELAVSLPYARPEEGTAAPFVRNACLFHRILALSFALVFLLLIYGLEGLIVLAIGWIVCKIFGFWCYKRIGGVTGDILGACSEIIETIILFLCATLTSRNF
jgi:adenosylcobinamide-GDP ribazoletransferase